MPERYEEVVDELFHHPRFAGEISLAPMQELMERLGHPERAFPAVHVAGTNGKGSTATIIERVLREEGYRTGLFTSPHLVDVRERIRVDGRPIARDAFMERYDAVRSTGVDVSLFECTAGMALDHFAAEEVDVAVVETGMGGRLDATNVVNPELSVITNVAREHTDWLGEHRDQIARELAGIIAEGTPVVCGATGAPAEVIRTVAAEHDVTFVPVTERVVPAETERERLVLRWNGDRVETNLVGRYQADNINTVLAACDALDRDVSRDAVCSALEAVDIPGRAELVSRSPLVLLDGAHNPAAVKRLPETLEALDAERTIAVVSIMADKDYGAMLSVIAAFADIVILAEAESDRAADPAELASCIDTADCEVVRPVPDALDTAVEVAGDDDLVLVTGSLYFVGDVKTELA